MEEDIYIRYLRWYYKENGTINDIISDVVVEFEGKTFNVGDFLSRMRSGHRLFLQGINHRNSLSSLSIVRYQALDEMNIDWSGPNGNYSSDEDIYIRYLRKHYEDRGTINNITRNMVVEFEGRKLKIGIFLQNIRVDHKKYISNPNMHISSTTRGRFAALDSLHYSWTQMRFRKTEDDLYIPFLREYYKENGTINDIENNFVGFYKGTKLDITAFFSAMRRLYKKVENGEEVSSLAYSRIQAMNEMKFLWEREINDVYIDFLMEFYKKHGTINSAELDRVFVYNGVSFNLDKFLYTIRFNYKRYLADRNNPSYNSPLMIYRYQKLNEMKFDWTIYSKGSIDDDIYIRYLRQHYAIYGTINDIRPNMVVEFEGRKVKIGTFVTAMRSRYRFFVAGSSEKACDSPLSLARYCALEKMNFAWEPSLASPNEKDVRDLFIEYLKLHYAKYGTINDIKWNFADLFEGKVLRVGVFLSAVNQKYKKYLCGDPTAATPLLLSRYEELRKMGYKFSDDIKNDKPISNDKSADSKPRKAFDVFREKFGDANKAQAFVRLIKSESRRKTGINKKYTLAHTCSVFGLDIKQFVEILDKNCCVGVRESDAIVDNIKGNISLKEFTSKFGYSYKALLYATKLRENHLSDEDLPSLVNRGMTETAYSRKQMAPNWIYSKYGNRELLDHFLMSVGFEPIHVYEDMRKKVIPLDQAIINESFSANSQDGEYDYLRILYFNMLTYYNKIRQEGTEPSLLQDALYIYLNGIRTSYSLTNEEVGVIGTSFRQYTQAMKQYQLYDVAFEKDENIRLAKQDAYHFDEKMKETAFFMPVEFGRDAMVGRNLELFSRRSLVKSIADSWPSLSSDEKTNCICQYDLNEEEIGHIDRAKDPKKYEKKSS